MVVDADPGLNAAVGGRAIALIARLRLALGLRCWGWAVAWLPSMFTQEVRTMLVCLFFAVVAQKCQQCIREVVLTQHNLMSLRIFEASCSILLVPSWLGTRWLLQCQKISKRGMLLTDMTVSLPRTPRVMISQKGLEQFQWECKCSLHGRSGKYRPTVSLGKIGLCKPTMSYWTHSPRLCMLTVTRLQVVRPLESGIGSVVLSASMKTPHRVLRSNQISLPASGLFDMPLEWTYSLQVCSGD